MRLTPQSSRSQALLQPGGSASSRATALPGGITITHRTPASATTEEAEAWADVLVRHGLLHSAVLVPTGQWLVQYEPGSPVRVLDGASAVLELAASIQQQLRTPGSRSR
ncbi:hypothetical protein ACIO3O_34845 [Streptomyces sp. NPDC087440]|uniref:hypothetical protein n=1 Tax=Streptomyces sp. NPDC087440 TaxID=3365790 RepID=UPI0038245CD4